MGGLEQLAVEFTDQIAVQRPSVIAPMPRHTAASRAICPASSRARRDQAEPPGPSGLPARFEDIPGATQRVDHR